MAERLGLEIIPLRSEWGKQMDPPSRRCTQTTSRYKLVVATS
ncbi:MAG: hypothetical protein Ct9H90mP2_14660 [Dehalococcoidia bacterium]|nr:MAG: hypothetical protein Ct9H90mP2_14660 [Dehalococcoidia bacterium]